VHTTEDITAQAPDLIAPVTGYRDWRLTADGLASPWAGTVWTKPVMRAECRPRRAEDLILAPHAAPHNGCTCGIHAYHRFSPEASKIDYRGVSGIVTAWGRIEAHEHGIRAEWARVEALGLYRRWTSRKIRAVMRVADELDIDVFDLEDLPEAAARYGSPLPEMLLPGRRREPVRALVDRRDRRSPAPPRTGRSMLVER
jgi:hypothetical protein